MLFKFEDPITKEDITYNLYRKLKGDYDCEMLQTNVNIVYNTSLFLNLRTFRYESFNTFSFSYSSK